MTRRYNAVVVHKTPFINVGTITVYFEKHMKPLTYFVGKVQSYYSTWYIYLPMNSKG